jgi:PAS domain-containing protein
MRTLARDEVDEDHGGSMPRSPLTAEAIAAACCGSLPSALIVLDQTQHIVYANKTALQLRYSQHGVEGELSDGTAFEDEDVIGLHISAFHLAVFRNEKKRLRSVCSIAVSAFQRAAHTQLRFLTDQSCRICDVDGDPASPIFCSSPLDVQVWTGQDDTRYLTLSFDTPFTPATRCQADGYPSPDITPSLELAQFVSDPASPSILPPEDNLDRDFVRYAQFLYNSSDTLRSAFFISADESVAVCNYRGGRREVHEVVDLEIFVKAQWKLYDADFKAELTFEEFPMVLAARRREEYRKSYGFITVEGDKMLLQMHGKLLYSASGDFMGSANWVDSLGSWEDGKLSESLSSSHRHEMIIEMLPHYVWTVSPTWTIDYFSSSWCDYTGIRDPYRDGWKHAVSHAKTLLDRKQNYWPNNVHDNRSVRGRQREASTLACSQVYLDTFNANGSAIVHQELQCVDSPSTRWKFTEAT